MPGNARQLTAEAEWDYPVRVWIAAEGAFGSALDKIHAWLDENCGAGSWKTAPSGRRAIGNDATAFYFRNAALAAAFVARWCEGGSNLPVGNGGYLTRTDPSRRRSDMPSST